MLIKDVNFKRMQQGSAVLVYGNDNLPEGFVWADFGLAFKNGGLCTHKLCYSVHPTTGSFSLL